MAPILPNWVSADARLGWYMSLHLLAARTSPWKSFNSPQPMKAPWAWGDAIILCLSFPVCPVWALPLPGSGASPQAEATNKCL